MNAELVRLQPFIDCTRGSGFSYFRISKSMMQLGHQLGISTDEVLLYTLLRDRAKLSYENRNYDEQGRLFVFCTRPNAAAYFGWSTRKVVDLFHALSEHHLIDEQAMFDGRGQQKATRIFLNVWTVPGLLFSQEAFNSLRFPALTVDTLLTMDIGDYYILPKTLLEDDRYHGLSLRAMLLYMLLLDRIALSQRFGRMDSNGLLWTTMDAELMAKELDCSKRSLTRATGELETIGLIERRAVSYAEKWRIYVRDFLPAAPDTQPEPTASLEPSDTLDGPLFSTEDTSAPFGANSAPLYSQICTPLTPDLHASTAISASPVQTDLHPTKHSSTKNPENKPSQTTSILAPAGSLPQNGQDALMPAPEKTRKDHLNEIELHIQSMELCHYSETVDLCYTQLSEADGDRAVEILDFLTDVIEEVLTSPLPSQMLGRESVPTRDVIRRFSELDEYITFLIVQKVLPHWAEIKDKAAYLRRILYLGSRQHRHEAFYLRKTLESSGFGECDLPY